MGSFSNSIRGPLFVGRLFAFVFFSMNKNGDKMKFVWCVPFLVAFVVCFLGGLKFVLNLRRFERQVAQVGDLLFLATSIVSIVPTSFYYLLRRKEFRRLLLEIDAFNDVLNLETSSSRKRFHFVVFLLGLNCLLVADIFLMLASGISLFFYFWVVLGLYISFAQQFLVGQIVNEIASQMNFLNGKFRRAAKKQMDLFTFKRFQRVRTMDLVINGVLSRWKVLEIASEVDNFFGFPQMVAFGHILLNLVSSIYFIIHLFMEEMNLEIISHILWSFCIFIDIIYSIKSWSALRHEVSYLKLFSFLINYLSHFLCFLFYVENVSRRLIMFIPP